MRWKLIAAGVLATACAAPGAGVAERAEPRGITFIQDDLEGALAKAAADGKPLFVDAWAPW